MSSSSVENGSGAEEGAIGSGGDSTPTGENNGKPDAGRIVELLEEVREAASTPEHLGNGKNQYKTVPQAKSPSEDGSLDNLPRRAGSPIDSLLSVPDESPSIQVG